MKRHSGLFLLAFVIAVLAAPAEAQDDKMTVTKVLDDYAAAFGSLNPTRVAPYYHEPLMLITTPRVSVFATRADIEAWLRPTLERLKERGYARSVWAQLHVKQLTDGLAA